MAKKKMVPIEAGTLLTISTGCYSDYWVRGVFRAKQTIEPEALRGRWLTEHPEQAEAYCFEAGEFLAWLAKQGLIEPLDSTEWHLGDYGSADEMWVDQSDDEWRSLLAATNQD